MLYIKQDRVIFEYLILPLSLYINIAVLYFFTMSENVVTSDRVAPKKTVSSKRKSEPKPKVELNERDRPIASSPAGYKFVYFSSGSAYVTAEGRTFTKDRRINLVSEQEAEFLLKLPNFRLPDQLELEEYAKEI